MKPAVFKQLITHSKLYLALVATWCLAGLMVVLFTDKTDAHIWLSSWHTMASDFFFKYLTHLGDGWTALAIGLVIMLMNYRKGVTFLVGVYAAGLVTQVLKRWVFELHVRPAKYIGSDRLELVQGVDMHELHSFPSGHTTAAFAMASMFVILYNNPKTQYWSFAVAALIAYSRIYLSQHFAEDVVAGTIVGIVVPYLVVGLFFQKFARLQATPFGKTQ